MFLFRKTISHATFFYEGIITIAMQSRGKNTNISVIYSYDLTLYYCQHDIWTKCIVNQLWGNEEEDNFILSPTQLQDHIHSPLIIPKLNQVMKIYMDPNAADLIVKLGKYIKKIIDKGC